MELLHKKAKRKSSKRKTAQRKFGAKMRKCGLAWRRKSDKFKRTHKWKAFLKKCM